MKILHINTWDRGGAANAALRLFNAQKKQGLDVSFLTLKQEGKDNVAGVDYYKDYLQNKYGKWIAKLVLLANRAYNQIPINFNQKIFFNRPNTIFSVHEHPLVLNADIIHFHSIVKFVDLPSFFKSVHKPVVWTMHDINPFNGGKHYDSMMNDDLISLEETYIAIKMQAFKQANIFAIGPSLWMTEMAQKSKLFAGLKHQTIPYCICSNRFFRVENIVAPNSNKKILFVAEQVRDSRKGFKYLFDALQYLDDNIELMVLGNASKEDFKDYKNVTIKGYIADSAELSKLYSQAVLYVIPSLEDNLPNTIIESLICGTPVVAFNTTGIANMIEDGENGILVVNFDAKALADGIKKALKMSSENQFSKTEIIRKAQQKYAEIAVVAAYQDVYTKMLDK